jgi:hypothetical protein
MAKPESKEWKKELRQLKLAGDKQALKDRRAKLFGEKDERKLIADTLLGALGPMVAFDRLPREKRALYKEWSAADNDLAAAESDIDYIDQALKELGD